MLKINDLTASKELDRSEMAEVIGGISELSQLSALIDFSTSTDNKVASVNQLFGLTLAQGNAGAVTNNQAIAGGNGIVFAPVKQDQTQGNYMGVAGIGNTSVS